MKTYDKAGTCIKCGYGGIEDVYWKAITIPARARELDRTLKNTKDRPEHIARTCKNCGYLWRESPLDGRPIEVMIKDAIEASSVRLADHSDLDAMADDPGGFKATCEMAKPDDPVFEVGDEITIQGIRLGRDDKIIHDVVAIVGGEIHARPRTVAYAAPDSCTLIRKGPKVITLEKVQGTGIAIYAGGVQTGFIEIDGDKGYTITATEEALK